MRKVFFNVVYDFGGLSSEEFDKIQWEGETPVFSSDMGSCLARLTCTIENTHTGYFAYVDEMQIGGRGTKTEWIHEFYNSVKFFDNDGTARLFDVFTAGYGEYTEERGDGDGDECVDWCDEKKFFPSFAECVHDAFDIGLGWLLNEERGNG